MGSIIACVICYIGGAIAGIGIMALMVAAADDREERGLLPEDKEGSDNGRR